MQTPVSAKGGRTYNRTKGGPKGNRSAPPTPASNAGKEFIIFTVSSFKLTFLSCVVNSLIWALTKA